MPLKPAPSPEGVDPNDWTWEAQERRRRAADEQAQPAILAQIPRLLTMERMLRNYASNEAFSVHLPLPGQYPADGANGRRLNLLMAMQRLVVLANEVIEALRDEDEPAP
jgi:hypothetical protein